MRLRKIAVLLVVAAAFGLAGCGGTVTSTKGPVDVSQSEIAALTDGILALGPGIDPEEAARIARISIEYSLQLRREYNVTDPPLIHNSKVNLGLRPRGLCYQWADDLEARLRLENFQTLILHRVIANSTNFRIEHSTVIASRPGDSEDQGMILDPWRYGGELFWAPTLEDTKYVWLPRAQVFAEKRRKLRAKGLLPPRT